MSAAPQPIKIAILAMGGEGGGVLADWLVDLAEHAGHVAQTTSVPGVAQRTGATIYYVEIFPVTAAADGTARAPVLALMPLPGDVDLVLASELMEAARAVQRGLVTPDRTTLIASTHRVYAIAEKIAPGDGRADAAALLADAQRAAKRFIGYDMAAAAEAGGSLISAVLFGALAGSGALQFERAQFETTIARGGVGVKASLAAFSAAFERARRMGATEPVSTPVPAPAPAPAPATALAPASAASASSSGSSSASSARSSEPAIAALLQRTQAHPPATRAIVVEGLRRLVDYQDPAYAALYLDRLEAIARLAGDHDELVRDLARHLALWMSYEDTIRVADLKTRDSRFARVRGEVRTQAGQLLHIEEYLHPRLQEIAETMPAALGRWLLASGWPRALVQRLGERGRVLRTSTLRGYLQLAAVAALRRWRRATLRYAIENARIERWLADIRDVLARGPGHAAHSAHSALALEVVRCQRLVKGYGDTHERGLAKFDRLRALWVRPGLGATQLATLRAAALADEEGQALQAELQRLAVIA